MGLIIINNNNMIALMITNCGHGGNEYDNVIAKMSVIDCGDVIILNENKSVFFCFNNDNKSKKVYFIFFSKCGLHRLCHPLKSYVAHVRC